MNVSGKVLKANIVRGRDAYELELRIAIKDGKCDVYAPTSGYVGNLATVALLAVPAEHWGLPVPAAELPQPAPSDFAPSDFAPSALPPLPLPSTPAPPEKPEARVEKPKDEAPPPAPPVPMPIDDGLIVGQVVADKPAGKPKASTSKKEG